MKFSFLIVKCPIGTERDINNRCVNCPIGQYSANEEGTCLSCDTIQTTFFTGARDRTMCRGMLPDNINN